MRQIQRTMNSPDPVNKKSPSSAATPPAPDSRGSGAVVCSPDGRDGPEAAATEIVMKLVGVPSLMVHEWVTSVIRRHLKERGSRPQNAERSHGGPDL